MKLIEKLSKVHELNQSGVSYWTLADSYEMGFRAALEMAAECAYKSEGTTCGIELLADEEFQE